MKIKVTILFLLVFLCNYMVAQDNNIDRVVTVEREFQPDVHHAYKIQLTPNFQNEEMEANPEVDSTYSTYSNTLSVDYNLHPLKAAKTDFTPQSTLKGILEGAVGHRNSHMLFGYRISEDEKMSLDLYATHNAYWGKDALSKSLLGMQLIRHFDKIDVFFGLQGDNEFFTYYGRYFTPNNGINIPLGRTLDQQNLWKIDTKIGLKSADKKKPVQFGLQTGYRAFIATNHAVENQVRTHFNLKWSNNDRTSTRNKPQHAAGVNLYLQNSFYSHQYEDDSTRMNRHTLKVEPFYEYKYKNLRLHAGVNVDINIGTGKLLSKSDKIAFAPSPNIEFEWNLMNNIFNLYTQAKGSLGVGTLEEYLDQNRYLNIQQGVYFNTPRSYTPADIQIGFKIRPIKTMLVDIYGGYAYMINACEMNASLDSLGGVTDYTLTLSDYQRWKVGGSIHYHYRDILDININGNYYAWKNKSSNIVYDRPIWDLYARIDAHIDSKWSIYSENYFAGKSIAQTSQGDQIKKPHISLNIGGQYAINTWLLVYLQLNNYIDRKNDIFYGYQSQGCHFLGGVKYKF